VVRLRDDCVIYSVRSEPGLSGAPCFNQDLELVALNTRRSDDARTTSEGVLMSTVMDDLDTHGLGGFLDIPFV
jgi:hypothetical protein